MRAHDPKISSPKRAALYIGMSTEHQDYSIANQAAALESYAEDQNMVIVKRFVDLARGSLTLSGRPGLKKLLRPGPAVCGRQERAISGELCRVVTQRVRNMANTTLAQVQHLEKFVQQIYIATVRQPSMITDDFQVSRRSSHP